MRIRSSQFHVPVHQLRAAARLVGLVMTLEVITDHVARPQLMDLLGPLYRGGRGARGRKLRRDLAALKELGIFVPETADGFDTFTATADLWRIGPDLARRLSAALGFLPRLSGDMPAAAAAASKIRVTMTEVSHRARDLGSLRLPTLDAVIGRRGAGDRVPVTIAHRVLLLRNAAWAADLRGVVPLSLALAITGCRDRATLRGLLGGLSQQAWPGDPDRDDVGLFVDVDVSATKPSVIRRWRFSAAEALAIEPWLRTMSSSGDAELDALATTLRRLAPPGYALPSSGIGLESVAI